MSRVVGPWVGMTLDQAKTYCLRAALAFKAREGRWPTIYDCEPWSWKAANAFFRRNGGVNITQLWGVEQARKSKGRTPEEKAVEILAFFKKHKHWPRSHVVEEQRLGRALGGLRQQHQGVCDQYGIPRRSRSRTEGYLDTQALAILAFFQENERWPRAQSGTNKEKNLGATLRHLRSDRPEVCLRHGIALCGGVTEGHWDTQALLVLAFFKETGRWPCRSVKDPASEEAGLGRCLNRLRKEHPALCVRHGIPLKADIPSVRRLALGREQFSNIGVLVPRLCKNFRCTQATPNVDGDSGSALNNALCSAHTNPSWSRGLGHAPDLCQVNSLARANSEIEHDCWCFTLKGAKKPDKRSWAAILASGDNKRIESAQRIAFLDWENPDKSAVRTGGKFQGVLPATRRPWSPPATQPEPGKPAAPAKGKGKRASKEKQ